MLVGAAFPFFSLYTWLFGHSCAELRQRLGAFNTDFERKHHRCVWFHAASVGEVQAVVAILAAMQDMGIKADIVITTVTKQGLLAAKRQCMDQAYCLFAPIDLPWVVERFIRRLDPSLYVCLETELWPNMLRLAKGHQIKTLLLNGRLSKKSLRKYLWGKPFVRQILACFDAAAVIHSLDLERYLALGFDHHKIDVYGNAKYDLPLNKIAGSAPTKEILSDASIRESTRVHYRAALDLAPDQPLLLAGSTHAGEEAILISVLESLLPKIPNLVLLLAPRHLDRLDQVKTALQRKQIKFQTFSQALHGQRNTQVIVLDRMGELAKLYAVATYVFCGGSLTPQGGHNIMEPAIWGKSPFYGPNMQDFRDARELLEEANAGFTVHDGQELSAKIWYLHRHQEEFQQAANRALAVSSQQQGSAHKQAMLVSRLLNSSAHHCSKAHEQQS